MVMRLLKLILKSTGKKGVPQGGVISPLLSNVYLNEVDRMLEKAIATTRRGQYTQIQYARFADDLVVLIDSHPRQDWLVKAVDKRLREELAKLKVEINEDKSRMVNLSKGESGGFLGFEYRLIRSRQGKWRTQLVPKMKKRTALLRKLKDIFQRYRSQPVGRVIEEINPILRGWVNYFRGRTLEPVLLVHQAMGGEEGSAASDACPGTHRDSAGSGGVANGSTTSSVCSMTTE